MWSFVVVSLILTFKTYFGGKSNPSSVRLHGKTVVITGANTGIGKETALELARRGAKIIIGCRDEKKSLDTMKEISKQTGNDDLEFIRLDLASFQSIRKFAKIVNKHVERIDILINNAGSIANRYTRTEDGHEKIFQVNYLGHFLLTELLMDKLKASAPSRIINVSSDAHLWCKTNTFREPMIESTFGSWLAYCQSKMAQIMSTREASKRLEGTGVSVFVVHPGTVRTEIGRDIPVLKYKIVSLLLVPLAYIFMKSAYQGAQTTIYCALERNLEQYSGEYFKECTHCDCNKKALDEDACKDLYKLSQKLTGMGKSQ